jgi:hypothetical protein
MQVIVLGHSLIELIDDAFAYAVTPGMEERSDWRSEFEVGWRLGKSSVLCVRFSWPLVQSRSALISPPTGAGRSRRGNADAEAYEG